MWKFYFTKFLIFVFFFLLAVGCTSSSNSDGPGKGGGAGNDIGGGGDTILAIPLGTWSVSTVSCNGLTITSSYIPVGVTMFYEFTPTQMKQTRTASGCSQMANVNITFSNSAIKISSGTEVVMSCNPMPCSGSGLSPSTICGINGSTSSDSVLQVKSTGANLIVTSTDAQAESTCVHYGSSGPLQLLLVQQ